MNADKYTQKSIEAVQYCQRLAYEFGNQEISEEHMLMALMKIDDSLIAGLIEKMGIDAGEYTRSCESALSKCTKVSGDVELRIGNDLNRALICAEDEAQAMGDKYVSVEHIYLSLIKYPNAQVKKLLDSFGITRDRFLKALSEVRGNKQVTTDNPEDTYDTLKKFGVDLVKEQGNRSSTR